MPEPQITTHAVDRFRERIGLEANARQELQKSVLAATLDDQDYMLSPCGAVFIVKDGIAVTTITKKQARKTLAGKCLIKVKL